VFGFKSKQEKQADKVLDLLARAIKEVHPDRFIDPLDAALFTQPRLVTLNRMLAKREDDRFSPVTFNELIARFALFQQHDRVSELVAPIGDDVVLMALALAAMHDRNNPSRQDDVRRQAELLLACLNKNSHRAPNDGTGT
jgi:hypothetical protein